MKEFVLNNGVKAPSLAYGTWLIKNEVAANCVRMALDAGYRHIDTAQAYGQRLLRCHMLVRYQYDDIQHLVPFLHNWRLLHF